MRRIIWLGVLCFNLVFAQDSLEQMRNNIEDGYYTVAALLLGPELIASETYKNDPEAHYLYAQALYLSSNIEEARAALDISFNLISSPPTRFRHLDGLLLAAEGSISRAVETLRNAFRESSDYEVGMDWGTIAWQAGNLEEALAAFEDAAKTDRGKRELWPHLNRGRIFKALNDYPKAIDAFNQTIEVFDANDVEVGDFPSPGYVEAFYQLGTVYEILGNLDEARLNYESARDVGSNYPPAVEALERLSN